MRRTVELRAGVGALIACCMAALAACDEPTRSPQALRVQATTGDWQTDTVGAVLPQPLVAEVTDQRGRPVAGLSVEFTVLSGGGSLQTQTVQSDARGRARAQLTLGTRTSEVQRVEARVAQTAGGSVPDTFTATVRSGTPVRMEALSPLRLSGVQGRPLADSVAVRIFDRFENPAAGRGVLWIVGSNQPVTSTARADGSARMQWTLARVDSEQTLRASASASAAVTFVATGSRRTLDVVIERPNTPVTGDTLQVVADTRASANQPTGVTAGVDGRSTALQLLNGRWRGALVLSGLVPGPKVLHVVVVDAAGNADTARVSIEYDPPPVLTLEEPEDRLAIGSYRVRASCRDDDPCTFDVWVNRARVAQAQGSIDQTFTPPSGFAGQVQVELQTRDAWNRFVMVAAKHPLYVINEPRWTLVTRVADGLAVIDMDATRLLLRNGAVVDRATGRLTQPFSGEPVGAGRLTRGGAIVVGDFSSELLEWRNGALVSLSRMPSWTFRAAGRWTVWRPVSPQGTGPDDHLRLRDLEAGVTQIIPAPYGPDLEWTSQDVAENGDVVYLDRDRRLLRYRNGTSTVLAQPNESGRPRHVRTGGNVVVYSTETPDTWQLRLIDAAGVDAALTPPSSEGAAFLVNNGWVAFERAERTQVWMRSPDGAQQQLISGGSALLGPLSPEGRLVMRTSTLNRVFVPGRGVISVGGPDLPLMLWVGDELYASWGGGLFRIAY